MRSRGRSKGATKRLPREIMAQMRPGARPLFEPRTTSVFCFIGHRLSAPKAVCHNAAAQGYHRTMAELVAVFALTHAPGVTGWRDAAPPGQRDSVLRAYEDMRRRLHAARPDVLIGVANDHILNFFLDNVPDFCVGVADRHSGPEPWFEQWLNIGPYTVPGHRDMAETLVREADRSGLRFAYAEHLRFDDNFSVPLHMLTPDMDIPFVPIHMNCIVPPLPSPERCVEVGRTIAEVISRKRPASERVALMATGGLSHDPGGPKYFAVDERFDRWFLELIANQPLERVIHEVTMDTMYAAGDGGTSELLSWFTAMGAAGEHRAEVIGYEAVTAWRCGTGLAQWI